ncbi:hypothetical protein Gpo141_00009598 [Globisporangium polare]
MPNPSPPRHRSRGGSASALAQPKPVRPGSSRIRAFTTTGKAVSSVETFDESEPSSSFSGTSAPVAFDGPIMGAGAAGGKVLLDDDQLLRRARALDNQIDFDALTDRSQASWVPWKRKLALNKHDFALFTRDHQATDDQEAPVTRPRAFTRRHHRSPHEVIAVGEVRCSVQELAHILQSSSEAEYNSVMHALFKNEFIYGSVVHVAQVPPSRATTTVFSRMSEDSESSMERLCVKTNAFTRSNIFLRNEQWCFLEYLRRDVSKDAFTLTLSSLLESELTAGKVKQPGRVTQLHNLLAGFAVEKIPETNYVHVLFHGAFSGEHAEIKGNASAGVTRSRLMSLAKGVRCLPDLVLRRRFGVQRLADRTAFAATNDRCTCCTKSLHLLSKKKRCYLCGYFVCDKDWSLQQMETRGGDPTPIRVCVRCLESVECCDYNEVTSMSIGRASIQRDPKPSLGSINGSISSSSGSGKALATFLHDALRNSTEQKKQSVMTVIKHLVTEEHRRLSDEENDNSSCPVILTEASDEHEYISALDQYFPLQPLPLKDCVLANSNSRAYPHMASESPSTIAVDYPVPKNEKRRVSVIEQGNLMAMTNADELNIICTLAARELDCTVSLVTIVGQETQLILASNVDAFKMVSMPRNQSFCQHTVMDSKPLLVPHPEADIRFAHLVPLKQNDIKFYCGFPIVDSSTNAVLGTVCCLDTKTHDLTQSQYSSMKRLADTASRVVRLKSQENAAAAGWTPPDQSASY